MSPVDRLIEAVNEYRDLVDLEDADSHLPRSPTLPPCTPHVWHYTPLLSRQCWQGGRLKSAIVVVRIRPPMVHRWTIEW